MRGTNPFERRVVETPVMRDPPQEPIVEPAVEDLTPVPEPEEPRENPLLHLVEGEDYEDLLVHAARTGSKSQILVQQDELDDDRFEHLHGEDWKTLEEHEDRVRAARAIARREGARDDECHAEIHVDCYEDSQRKEHKKKVMWICLLLWAALGAVMTAAEGGPVGFFLGGVTFFFVGAFLLWVVSLFQGIGNVRGRAV